MMAMLLRVLLFSSSVILAESFGFGAGGGCGCGCSPPPPPPTVRCAPPGGFKCPPAGCGKSSHAGGYEPPPVSKCNHPPPPPRCGCGCGRKKRELMTTSRKNELTCESGKLKRIMQMSIDDSAAVWLETIRRALHSNNLQQFYVPFCTALNSSHPRKSYVACEMIHNGNTCRIIKTKIKANAESTLRRTMERKNWSQLNA
uniref:Ground-like domain-containing protein n=2 Tax=Parascaris univalens TaxID=6257 RepID=A0A915BVS2_PARUN